MTRCCVRLPIRRCRPLFKTQFASAFLAAQSLFEKLTGNKVRSFVVAPKRVSVRRSSDLLMVGQFGRRKGASVYARPCAFGDRDC